MCASFPSHSDCACKCLVLRGSKYLKNNGKAETAGTELTVNENCNKGISNYTKISIPYDRIAIFLGGDFISFFFIYNTDI